MSPRSALSGTPSTGRAATTAYTNEPDNATAPPNAADLAANSPTNTPNSSAATTVTEDWAAKAHRTGRRNK